LTTTPARWPAGCGWGTPPGNRSVCDAIVTEMPGEMTFAITQPRVGAGLTVSDDEALAAVAFAVRELKLVVEPGGAVALAALLAGRVGTRGEVTMAVVTGGNIDPVILGRAITDPELPRFVPRG
jgi:threonine dehydratase